jgi:hypothetical protein
VAVQDQGKVPFSEFSKITATIASIISQLAYSLLSPNV